MMRLVVVGLFLIIVPVVAVGQMWNFADDFSADQNPNGAWVYGWREAGSDPLILYTDHGIHPYLHCDVDCWYHDINSGCPQVGYNPHETDIVCNEVLVIPSHKGFFHPGPGQQSVVRWIAPAGGALHVVADFTMICYGSDTVRVFRNGTGLFSAVLDGFGHAVHYTATFAVQPGDVIDCTVDPISFYGSTTQLDLSLTLGPAIGACCFAGGACLLGTEGDCALVGGDYMGDGSMCDPYPCGATPVDAVTWGQIKARFH